MAFSNQNSSIVMDSMGNLYNFLLDNKEITLIYFDKLMGNVEKSIITNNCKDEFYSIVNQYDDVYLVYQDSEGDIKMVSFSNGMKELKTIKPNIQTKVYNLRIIDDYEDIHMFYCVPDNSDRGQFKKYHCEKRMNKWTVKEIGNISIYDILNPFEVINIKDEMILGYYDLVRGVEQVFIKKLNLAQSIWSNGIQLTSQSNKKLYLDMLVIDDDLHITYSEEFEGNYVIKYEMLGFHKEKVDLIYSHILSNPSNCSHPTLIKHRDKLWNIWIEHDSVISAFSEDNGKHWSEPYLWNESKSNIFSRYKFSSNETKVKTAYNLNYSFGKQYPDITFLGFGNLSNTTKIPIKKKEDSTRQKNEPQFKEVEYRKEDLDDIYSTFYTSKKNISSDTKTIEKKSEKTLNSIEDLRRDIEKIHNDIKEINHYIYDLQNVHKDLKKSITPQDTSYEEEIKKLSKRIEQIESYLTRRRRGLF